MRIFCRTLVLVYRPWRNFWLPFRKRLITNNRLCPCIYLAPATRGKATFASIVFSASTAMPIQTFPMRNATSYPCRLHLSNTYIEKKKAFVCRLFNAFFVCFFLESACCTTSCPTHLSRSSTSNVSDPPLVLAAISSSATDMTAPLWASPPLDSKNIISDLFFLQLFVFGDPESRNFQ